MTELGNISVGEVGQELGRRWAVLDNDRKGRYETIYMEAKVRYEERKKRTISPARSSWKRWLRSH